MTEFLVLVAIFGIVMSWAMLQDLKEDIQKLNDTMGDFRIPFAKLSPEAHDRLKTGWEAAHRGATNAHRVAVLKDTYYGSSSEPSNSSWDVNPFTGTRGE